MCKDEVPDSLTKKVKISPRKYKDGLKHLLSVSKEQLDARVLKDREQRQEKLKSV